MSKIILRLYGGLGNQIFQISAAILFSERFGENKINIDDSYLIDYSVGRENGLELFFDFNNIGVQLCNVKSFVHKLRLSKIFNFNSRYTNFISDKNFASSVNGCSNSSSYLDGYFQDCLTTSDFVFLVSTFKSCLLPYQVINKSTNCCVIHVRGGDFVKLGWDAVASTDYYIRAIEFMIEQYAVETFDIITDDVAYAKFLLEPANVHLSFVKGSIQDDFYNIGSYSYRVLSSSTFAFWASALGSNSNPVVIAPEFWSPGRKRLINLPGEVFFE